MLEETRQRGPSSSFLRWRREQEHNRSVLWGIVHLRADLQRVRSNPPKPLLNFLSSAKS